MRGRRGIDGDGHAPELLDGEVGDHEFRDIGEHDDDLVPFSDAPASERIAERIYGPIETPVCQADIVVDDSRSVPQKICRCFPVISQGSSVNPFISKFKPIPLNTDLLPFSTD